MTFSITQTKIQSPFNHLYKTLPVWLSPASNSPLGSHCFSNPISYYPLIIHSPPAILSLFCSSNIPDLPRPQGLCTLCSLFLVCSFCQYLWVLLPHFFFFTFFLKVSFPMKPTKLLYVQLQITCISGTLHPFSLFYFINFLLQFTRM